MTTRVIIGVAVMGDSLASLPASERKREETPGRSRTEFDGQVRFLCSVGESRAEPQTSSKVFSGRYLESLVVP